MTHRLTETTPLSEAGISTSGRMRVHAITAGLGSSGYYSPDVLREAATNNLIAKGTPLFLDHPSESDRLDRPERSVRDIAAVFTESATYDEDQQALGGEIQVFAPYRELLTEMAPHIGLSISGSATNVVEGEVDGRRVPVIEGLAKIDSVDWVTRAGRGGRVVELLESIRTNRRARAHGISEATVNDTREALQQVLRDTYGGEKTYVWVRDFDDSTVWFEVSVGDNATTYGQPYSETDGVVALDGMRTEVRLVTNYVPATRPDSTTTTQESKEDTMATIQIEESDLARLREDAGRVTALEERATTAERERDTFRSERDEARAALAESQARQTATGRARSLITEANATLPPATVNRIIEAATHTVPLTESGALDEAAFTTQVETARTAEETYLATLAEAAGAGRVTGLGLASVKEGEVTRETTNQAIAEAFGRPTKTAKEA